MSDQTSKSDQGHFEPFHISDVPVTNWTGKNGDIARFQVLSKFGGGSNVGVGIDELDPGKYSNEFHYHLTEEEHVFILEGSATLFLGEKSYVMGQGDYCCFPAGQRAGHHLYNHTDQLCKFMTIGENRPHDVCYYPKLKTIRVKGTTEMLQMLEQ